MELREGVVSFSILCLVSSVRIFRSCSSYWFVWSFKNSWVLRNTGCQVEELSSGEKSNDYKNMGAFCMELLECYNFRF